MIFNVGALIRNFLISLQIEMPFYAVAQGRIKGVYPSWSECEAQVKGFSGAIYKKFNTRQEAEVFIKEKGTGSLENNTQYTKKLNKIIEKSNNDVKINNFHQANTSYLTKRTICLPLENINTSTKFSDPQAKKTKATVVGNNPVVKDGVFLNKTTESEIPSTIECNTENFTNFWDTNSAEDDILIASAEKNIPLFEAPTETKAHLPKDSPRSNNLNSRKRKERCRISYTRDKIPRHECRIWKAVGTKTYGKYDFPIDSEGYVLVYTDGSCENNGKRNAVAGFGVYFSENHPLNVARPVSGRATNNCGEIQATTCAINIALENGIKKLCINTDSQFLLNSVMFWMPIWKSNNWKLKTGQPVKNYMDFKALDEASKKDIFIKWNYVKAHRGIDGNEKADMLAKEGAILYKVRNKYNYKKS